MAAEKPKPEASGALRVATGDEDEAQDPSLGTWKTYATPIPLVPSAPMSMVAPSADIATE
jgi:hypothetical protein